MASTNYKTHKLLGYIYKHHSEKYQSSGRGVTYNESLTVIELQKLSNFQISEIEIFCSNLLALQYIEFVTDENKENIGEDIHGKNHRYIITPTGQKAYLNKVFTYRISKFYLPIVFSLVATSLSLYTCSTENSNKKELQITKEEVQHLKESLDSVILELNQQQ